MQWAFGAIGWSPEEFWSATPIELKYAIQGWKVVNCVEKPPQAPLSKSTVDELKELIKDEDDGS